jgi:signal transduction histidine kinase
MSTPTRKLGDLGFLDADGEAAACARAVDWSATALGAAETWPISLRSMVGLVLRSRHPMFIFWGPDLIQLYNDAYVPSFGVGKHPRAMGQPGRECWQEIWPTIGPQIDRVMSHADATWKEDQLVPIHRNGRLEDVYWSYGYSPIPDDEGGVGGTLLVCVETTSRVVAERRLRAARSLTEQLGLADDTTGCLRVAAKVFAETPEDVPFSLLFLLEAGRLELAASSGLTPAALAVFAPFVSEQLPNASGGRSAEASGGVFRGRLTLPTGSTLPKAAPAAFFSALFSSTEAGLIGYVVFGVTPALPFDQPYQAHLEELVATVSRACTREILRGSRETIQQKLLLADRMVSIGTLAAGAAHEINNPLAYMTANLDMALEEVRALGGGSAPALMRELEEKVLAARDGAERVHKIVRGLKTFSRTEEKRRAVIAIGPVLELSINMVFNEIRHHSRLVKSLGATPLVDVDEALLAQVFVNLLVNAGQAMSPSKSDTNQIHVVTSSDAAGRAVIEVRDTGAGIPAAALERIFDPFFTTKAVGVGSGLGLSICHNIVSDMGGEITVQSEEGRGASFRVVLPAAAHQSEQPQVARPASLAPEREPIASGRDREPVLRRAAVLVVDDEPAVGVMLARALREHEVTISASARKALEMLASGRRFDVILSDLMMPEVSGMEFYDEVARLFPELIERLVFVTGGAFSAAAREFLLRIPNARIEKPLDVKKLRALVRSFAK